MCLFTSPFEDVTLSQFDLLMNCFDVPFYVPRTSCQEVTKWAYNVPNFIMDTFDVPQKIVLFRRCIFTMWTLVVPDPKMHSFDMSDKMFILECIVVTLRTFLPSADSKAVCRRLRKHFLTPPPPPTQPPTKKIRCIE
jgi:hypothetical protein